MANNENLSVEFDADTKGFLRGVKEIQSAVGDFEDRINNAFGEMDKDFSKFGGNATSAGKDLSGAFSEGISALEDTGEEVEEVSDSLSYLGKQVISPKVKDEGIDETKKKTEGLGEEFEKVSNSPIEPKIKDEGIDETKKKTEDLGEEFEKVNNSPIEPKIKDEGIDETKRKSEDLGESVEGVGLSFIKARDEAKEFVDGVTQGIGVAIGEVKSLQQGVEKTGKWWTKNITAPIVAVGTATVLVGANFDDQMSTIQAVTSASTEEMEDMRGEARRLGKTTRYSASEVGVAMENLSRAGFTVSQTMDSVEDNLNLATAGAIDLGEASSITANMVNGFNLEAGDAGRISDVLSKTAADSDTTVSGLGDTLSKVAPTANALGLELEEVSAAAAVMGDAGMDAAVSGTALQRGLLNLSSPTKDQIGLMEQLGMEFFDTEGRMKPLNKVVGELEKGLSGMTDKERVSTMEQLFGSSGVAGWTNLLEAGSDEIKNFEDNLRSSRGYAKEFADTAEDNLAGSFRSMKSAIEELMHSFYEIGEGPLKDIVDKITEIINKFSELDDGTKQKIIIIAGALASIGVLILGIAKAMEFVIGVMYVLEAVSIITGLTMTASFGWIVLAVVAVIGVAYILIKYFKEIMAVGEKTFLQLEKVIIFFVKVGIKLIAMLVKAIIKNMFLLPDVFMGIFTLIGRVLALQLEYQITLFEKFVGTIAGVIDKIGSFFGKDWGLKDNVTGIADGFRENKEAMTDFFDKTEEGYEGFKENIYTTVDTAEETSHEIVGIWEESNQKRTEQNNVWIEELKESSGEKSREAGEGMVRGYQEGIESGKELPQQAMGEVVDGVVTETEGKNGEIRTSGRKLSGSLSEGIEEGSGRVRGSASRVVDGVRGEVEGKNGEIRVIGHRLSGNLSEGIVEGSGRVRGGTAQVLNEAKGEVSDSGSDFYAGGRGVSNNIARGIEANQGGIRGALMNALQKARDMLPQSPPKDKSSPLATIHKNGIAEQIAEGIYNDESSVDNAMRDLLTFGSIGADMEGINLEVGGYREELDALINGNVQANVGTKQELDVEYIPLDVQVGVNIGGRNYDTFVEDISEHMDNKMRRLRR